MATTTATTVETVSKNEAFVSLITAVTNPLVQDLLLAVFEA
jgi:hypothetical protein